MLLAGVRLLKKLYSRLLIIRQFLLKEIELNGFPRALWKYRFLLRGYHSDKRALYQLGKNGLPLPTYLSDYDRLKTKRLNGPYRSALDDKVLFSKVFDGFVQCPRDYGLLDNEGRFQPLQPSLFPQRGRSLAELLPLLPTRLVLKRVGGGGGKHIYLLERVGDVLTVNGKPSSVAEITRAIDGKRFLLCQFITQAQFANNLFSGSVNTVRVVTINDGESPPWIAFAVQRIGRKESAPTDNFNRGGLCALVDLDTGEVGEALYYSGTEKPKAFTKHPDTGAPISGQRVPHWPEIQDGLLRLVQRFPGFRYVGWDVVLQDDGFMLLEGNSYPGVQVIQLHKPLFEIPRMAEFFLQQGVISRRKYRSLIQNPAPPVMARAELRGE